MFESDNRNDILNRIAENKQKISLFELMVDSLEKEFVINHLNNEIIQLEKYI